MGSNPNMHNQPRLKHLWVQYGGLLAALGLLVGFFAWRSQTFWSPSTLTTIANSVPDLTIVAVGMTLILIVGGIDLSVGSVLALSASVMAVLMLDYRCSFWLAALACLGVGVGCGAINGWLSAWFRIPAFIVTLGMLEIARGGAYLVTRSETKYLGSSVEWLSEPIAGVGVSLGFVLALLCVIAGQWLLHRTVLGRYAVAIGTNVEAVRMSGITPIPTQVIVYGLGGLLCGVAAIIQTSRLSTADPNAGAGLELSAIAACVIGGTSLRGGQGSVVSTFFGVLVVSVLQTGLAQMGASDPVKRIVTGSVIVLAVLLDSIRASAKG